MRVALMSAWNLLYQPLAQIAAPIMQSYCNRHGYTFIGGEYDGHHSDRLVRGDLCKAAMYRQYHRDFDVLMWLDVDSIIMNHAIKIEDVLGEREFLWTCDINGPLSGFWIARNKPIIRQFMDRFAFACAYEDGGGDQYAMQIIMQRPPYRFIADCCVLGKEAGHCYDYDVMGYPKDLMFVNGYEPGDWLVTFPGMPIDRRLELMASYASRIQDIL